MFAAIGNLIVSSGGLGGSVGGRDRDCLKSSISAPIAASPMQSFMATVTRYQDYLNNPPMDYTTDRAAELGNWAKRQQDRLTAAILEAEKAGDLGDRYDDLCDARAACRQVARKADSCIEGDHSLRDFEG